MAVDAHTPLLELEGGGRRLRRPMRRFVGAAIVAVAALGPGSAGEAGPPATNGTDTLQLEAAVRPASAVARGRARPVALDLTLRYTSVSGGVATPPRTSGFDLPDGLDVNVEPRPRCHYRALLARGLAGCSRRSRVGSGTAVLDGRTAGRGYALPAKVRVFSAVEDAEPPPPGFRAARVLVVYVYGTGVEAFAIMGNNARVDRSALGFGKFRSIPAGVAIEEVRLTLRRMRWPKREGGKPLVQAPTRCTGVWHFEASFQFVRFGPKLVAADDIPCRAR